MVLEVGARFSGHASAGTLTSTFTVAARASVGLGTARERDQRHAEAADVRHEHRDLGGLAGV